MKDECTLQCQRSGYLTLFLFIIITIFTCTICYAEDPSSSSILKNRENTSGTITISEGLRLATEKNRILRIASLNKDIAYTDTLVAQSRFLPSIDASANYTLFAHQPGFRFGTQNAYSSEKSFPSYGITVHQTLYDFGARTSKYDASKALLEATNLDITKTRNLVALDFINAYCDLLETEKMIVVAQKERESLESHLKDAQSLFNEGVITKNDLLQAEVRLSDARQKLLTMKNVRAVNASRINNILARPLREDITVVDVSVNNPQTIELDKAWEYAEKQRTELQRIDQELKIAGLEEIVKKSEYYPTIYALGGYNYSENRYMLHDDNWSLIFGLNLNLFSGGSTKAEVAKIKYKRDQLLEQRNKLLDDIKLEVKINYLDMENAKEKIQVTKDAVSQAEENLRINKIRYKEGIGTATDVLDAITLLTTAETNYYRAVYDFRRAQAGLMYATGSDLLSSYL